MPTRAYSNWNGPTLQEINEAERRKFLTSIRQRKTGHRF